MERVYRKLKVMTDGIELGKGPVTIKMRPGALRVITTEKSPGSAVLQKDRAKMTLVPAPPLMKIIIRRKSEPHLNKP